MILSGRSLQHIRTENNHVVSEAMVLKRTRKSLSSRKAMRAFRTILVVVALVLIIEAMKTAQVLQLYDVEFGTILWLVCILTIASSAVAIICMILMAGHWEWSVWVWAVVVLGIALAGISIGIHTGFLVRSDVALPWVVLAVSAALKSHFATPWKRTT